MASGTGLATAGVGTGRALAPDSRCENKEEIIRDFFRFSWSAGFPSLAASLLGSADSERGASVVE